jgi:hypothetical protein
MELIKALVGLLSTHATTSIYYLHDHNELHMHRRLVPQQRAFTGTPLPTSLVQTRHQHVRRRSIIQTSDTKI